MKTIVVLLAAVVSTAFAGIPWEPEAKTDAGWVNLHNSFVENSRVNNGSVNVLFYGDSITQFWDGAGKPVFEQYYKPLGAANYGISADRTEHVLWRVINNEVDWIHPAVCVLKIGTNNIGPNDEPSIARGVETIVTELRQRLPNMKILLLGVLPRSNEDMTRRTTAINDIIKNLENGNTIRYLDMKQHFYNGGNSFNTELYTDLLHLSEAGYRKWAEVMDPLFREMLGSQ